MSPLRSTETLRAQGVMSANGEAEQPVHLDTIESLEVPQPQVAVPVDDEAH